MRIPSDVKDFETVLLNLSSRVKQPRGFAAAYLVADDAVAAVENALHSAGLSIETHQGGSTQIPRYTVTGSRRRVSAGEGALSPRERQILVMIAAGEDNQSIAQELSLSVETIKANVRKVLVKMGARNRTHAVHIAHEWDILR